METTHNMSDFDQVRQNLWSFCHATYIAYFDTNWNTYRYNIIGIS